MTEALLLIASKMDEHPTSPIEFESSIRRLIEWWVGIELKCCKMLREDMDKDN
jgi:hypothetical protein